MPQSNDSGGSSGVDRRSLLQTVGAGAVVGSASMLAGCSGGGGEQETEETTEAETTTSGGGEETETTTEEPAGSDQMGGTLTVALQSDPWTLHPHMYQDTSSSQLAINYGSTLVETGPNGELIPDLAEEIPEPTDGGTTYTFKIREGVQFHGDYGEVTAENVVNNYHTILDSEYGSPARADYEGVLVGEGIDPEETVQATGDYEVTFNLPNAYAPFLYKLADGRMSVIPMEAYEEHGEDYGTPSVGTWGTGPFQYVEGTPDSEYVFERNPDYFKQDGEGNTLPYVDELVFKVVPEASVRKTQIQTGDIDISEMVPARDVETLENAGGVKINSRPGSSNLNLYINQTTYEPFTNKSMRKALAYAISQEACIQSKFNGLAAKGHSLFPPWHWAYDEEVCTKYDQDVAKAKSLAQEAGYAGHTFNCSPTNQPLFVDIATIMQQTLGQANLNMEITPKEKSAAWEPTIGAWDPEAFEPKDQVGPPTDYHSHVEDITYGFDADGYSYITFHTNAWLNVSYYSDEEADEWMEQARVETDRETRKQLYSDLQAKISDDIPQIFNVWWNVNQAYRENVKNLKTYPSFDIQAEKIWKQS